MSLFPAIDAPPAEFSPCRQYRYTLWRVWGDDPRYVNFICLNPSTADDVQDDNTIRRCRNYAKAWGFNRMCVTNIFAFRATDPKVMKAQKDPIGPNNDFRVASVAREADLRICSWGTHGQYLSRSTDVLKIIDGPLHVLRMGKLEPWHPLYLPNALTPQLWEPEL